MNVTDIYTNNANINSEHFATNDFFSQEGKLVSYNLKEFLSMPIPKAEYILHPILCERRNTLIYAPRGAGKTWFCLTIAWAAASGTSFIDRWPAMKACKVTYIDGEMAADDMQERLKLITGGKASDQAAENFRLITPDLCSGPMPNIATTTGQDALTPLIMDSDLIFIDNISSFCLLNNENDAESWGTVREWMFYLRKMGKTVVLVHHAGKNGQQRGTSSREDNLEITISLKHPKGYRIDQGARFEVHFEKARGIVGGDAKPFALQMIKKETEIAWEYRPLSPEKKVAELDPKQQKIISLSEQGKSLSAIAEETNTPRSTVQRIIKRAKATDN